MKTWTTHNGIKISQIVSGRSNVFLLTNGKCTMLIDTSHKRKRKKLENNLNELSRKHIDYLILTHTHFDHAGNAAFIHEKYHPQLIVHQSEAEFLIKGASPLPKGSNFITKILIALVKNFPNMFRFAPAKCDIQVTDTLAFPEFDPSTFILSTPGHSSGSLSLVVDDEIAIVGDTMFGFDSESIFPPFADDVFELTKSWGKLLVTNCFVFLPAHGKAIIRERVEKAYQNRKVK